MADMQFRMKCIENHEWLETYPTAHTLFGICPKCPGAVQGKVLYVVDERTNVHEGVFVHQCITPGCGTLVEFDDEPCCFKHSPDEGSHLPFYSARERLTQGITPPQ